MKAFGRAFSSGIQSKDKFTDVSHIDMAGHQPSIPKLYTILIMQATLSGAIDVVVIEQENGDLACSPFHVRFGKFSLLLPSEKKVHSPVLSGLTAG